MIESIGVQRVKKSFIEIVIQSMQWKRLRVRNLYLNIFLVLCSLLHSANVIIGASKIIGLCNDTPFGITKCRITRLIYNSITILRHTIIREPPHKIKIFFMAFSYGFIILVVLYL